jgi:IS30 family transposase
MNGRLRRYLSRDTDLDLVGQWYLDLLSKKMNNTPRKCLGFSTPKEKMQQFSKILDRNIF